jgi:6-pyruvoyltetrahydropterin/6-carboxytetrahydropterin synthase
MKVGVIEHFDSMHLLPGHPKCGVPHGHTYRVEVTVEGPVTNGMVIDFDVLKRNLRELLKTYDHTDLNGLISFPSCENISTEILAKLKERLGGHRLTVRVWEGEAKWAEAEG